MSGRFDCISASFPHSDVTPKQDKKATFKHLNPLSKYTRMVCQERCGPSKPFCSLQVQIPNNNTDRCKRKRDDSCLDETCETPLKTPHVYSLSSPDEGFVSDCFDFLSRGRKRSTPLSSWDVTPTHSKIVHSSTPIKSTPLSQCIPPRLPSPIPVLNWDGDISRPEASHLTGCSGDGRRKVRDLVYVPISPHESPDEWTADAGVAVAKVEEEEVSRLTDLTDDSLVQVQVKSKVVVPESAVFPKPHREIKRIQTPVQRSSDDWRREVKIYVESVEMHMARNGKNDVMTELHQLMSTVAGQNRGQQQINRINNRSWQHPSDLTKRNYKSAVRGPFMSLSEWQKRNNLTYRRFAEVNFIRSPMP